MDQDVFKLCAISIVFFGLLYLMWNRNQDNFPADDSAGTLVVCDKSDCSRYSSRDYVLIERDSIKNELLVFLNGRMQVLSDGTWMITK